MLYCVKPEPEPEPDSEPEPEPEPEPDSESEPPLNSQLYMPDWSGAICPCDQAEECTGVYHYNAEHWVCFNWKKTFRLNWSVINHLSWIFKHVQPKQNQHSVFTSIIKLYH